MSHSVLSHFSVIFHSFSFICSLTHSFIHLPLTHIHSFTHSLSHPSTHSLLIHSRTLLAHSFTSHSCISHSLPFIPHALHSLSSHSLTFHTHSLTSHTHTHFPITHSLLNSFTRSVLIHSPHTRISLTSHTYFSLTSHLLNDSLIHSLTPCSLTTHSYISLATHHAYSRLFRVLNPRTIYCLNVYNQQNHNGRKTDHGQKVTTLSIEMSIICNKLFAVITTRKAQRASVSAKQFITPICYLDPDMDPDHLHNLINCSLPSYPENLIESVNDVLSNVADKLTNAGRSITSLVEVVMRTHVNVIATRAWEGSFCLYQKQ